MDSFLKNPMKINMTMVGSINGHEFECEGVGEGYRNKGKHDMKITVTRGSPLPFAFDILLTCASYGGKAFVEHVEVPDFFDQSFPEGFTWESTTVYEDGGYLTYSQTTRTKKTAGALKMPEYHFGLYSLQGKHVKKVERDKTV